MNRTSVTFLSAGLLLTGAVSVSAQQPVPVAELLPTLVAESAVITPGASGDHSQHFTPSGSDLAALYQLHRVLALQVGAFPLGPGTLGASPSGIDGGPGPIAGGTAADTAFTLGGGRMGLSFAYQATTFDKLDGLDLRSSAVNLFIPHSGTAGDDSDRDMMQQTLSLRLNRKVFSLALTYGLADRLDIGVVLPIVQVAADARVTTRILRTASTHIPAVHEFDPIGGANRTLPRFCSDLEPGFEPEALECHGSSTARGIGDVVVRAKYRLAGGATGVAIGTDVRLPTGNTDDLIGLGALQVRPSVTFSAAAGRVVPRARVDYTWSQGDLSSLLRGGVDRSVPHELGVAAGLDAPLSRPVTLVFDVAARRLDGLPEITRGNVIFPSRGAGFLPSADFLGVDQLQVGASRTVTQIMAAGGVRVALPGAVLAQMSVLVPMGDEGLQPGPMAVFSLSRSY